MRPEVVLLDVGGTLSWPPFERVNALLRDLQGQEVPLQSAYRGFYRSSHALESYFREHGRYPHDDQHNLIHWVYERGLALEGFPGLWTMECTDELARREGRLGNWDYTFPWVQDALRMLKEAGFRLGAVSNSDGHVAELLTRIGYAEFLEVIIDSEVEGISKPDPAIFHLALTRMGLTDYAEMALRAKLKRGLRPPVVYVGDNYSADYRGALGAGLTPVLLDPLGLWNDVAAAEKAETVLSFAQELCQPPARTAYHGPFPER